MRAGLRRCDHPDCAEAGEHRAPRDRGLKEYYWFCLEHVRAYNAAWDYFRGMSATEIEACRKLSKTKAWRVTRLIEKAKTV